MTDFLGRHPDQFTLPERFELAGKWVALELYTPATLPLKKIEAVGLTSRDCARAVEARGLDPAGYEYVQMPAPY